MEPTRKSNRVRKRSNRVQLEQEARFAGSEAVKAGPRQEGSRAASSSKATATENGKSGESSEKTRPKRARPITGTSASASVTASASVSATGRRYAMTASASPSKHPYAEIDYADLPASGPSRQQEGAADHYRSYDYGGDEWGKEGYGSHTGYGVAGPSSRAGPYGGTSSVKRPRERSPPRARELEEATSTAWRPPASYTPQAIREPYMPYEYRHFYSDHSPHPYAQTYTSSYDHPSSSQRSRQQAYAPAAPIYGSVYDSAYSYYDDRHAPASLQRSAPYQSYTGIQYSPISAGAAEEQRRHALNAVLRDPDPSFERHPYASAYPPSGDSSGYSRPWEGYAMHSRPSELAYTGRPPPPPPSAFPRRDHPSNGLYSHRIDAPSYAQDPYASTPARRFWRDTSPQAQSSAIANDPARHPSGRLSLAEMMSSDDDAPRPSRTSRSPHRPAVDLREPPQNSFAADSLRPHDHLDSYDGLDALNILVETASAAPLAESPIKSSMSPEKTSSDRPAKRPRKEGKAKKVDAKATTGKAKAVKQKVASPRKPTKVMPPAPTVTRRSTRLSGIEAAAAPSAQEQASSEVGEDVDLAEEKGVHDEEDTAVDLEDKQGHSVDASVRLDDRSSEDAVAVEVLAGPDGASETVTAFDEPRIAFEASERQKSSEPPSEREGHLAADQSSHTHLAADVDPVPAKSAGPIAAMPNTTESAPASLRSEAEPHLAPSPARGSDDHDLAKTVADQVATTGDVTQAPSSPTPTRKPGHRNEEDLQSQADPAGNDGAEDTLPMATGQTIDAVSDSHAMEEDHLKRSTPVLPLPAGPAPAEASATYVLASPGRSDQPISGEDEHIRSVPIPMKQVESHDAELPATVPASDAAEASSRTRSGKPRAILPRPAKADPARSTRRSGRHTAAETVGAAAEAESQSHQTVVVKPSLQLAAEIPTSDPAPLGSQDAPAAPDAEASKPSLDLAPAISANSVNVNATPHAKAPISVPTDPQGAASNAPAPVQAPHPTSTTPAILPNHASRMTRSRLSAAMAASTSPSKHSQNGGRARSSSASSALTSLHESASHAPSETFYPDSDVEIETDSHVGVMRPVEAILVPADHLAGPLAPYFDFEPVIRVVPLSSLHPSEDVDNPQLSRPPKRKAVPPSASGQRLASMLSSNAVSATPGDATKATEGATGNRRPARIRRAAGGGTEGVRDLEDMIIGWLDRYGETEPAPPADFPLTFTLTHDEMTVNTEPIIVARAKVEPVKASQDIIQVPGVEFYDEQADDRWEATQEVEVRRWTGMRDQGIKTHRRGRGGEPVPDPTPDEQYLSLHRKFEIFERKQRSRDKETLQHDRYKMRTRVDLLQGMSEMAWETVLVTVLSRQPPSGPLANYWERAKRAITRRGADWLREILVKEGEEVLERYNQLLPPEARKPKADSRTPTPLPLRQSSSPERSASPPRIRIPAQRGRRRASFVRDETSASASPAPPTRRGRPPGPGKAVDNHTSRSARLRERADSTPVRHKYASGGKPKLAHLGSLSRDASAPQRRSSLRSHLAVEASRDHTDSDNESDAQPVSRPATRSRSPVPPACSPNTTLAPTGIIIRFRLNGASSPVTTAPSTPAVEREMPILEHSETSAGRAGGPVARYEVDMASERTLPALEASVSSRTRKRTRSESPQKQSHPADQSLQSRIKLRHPHGDPAAMMARSNVERTAEELSDQSREAQEVDAVL